MLTSSWAAHFTGVVCSGTRSTRCCCPILQRVLRGRRPRRRDAAAAACRELSTRARTSISGAPVAAGSISCPQGKLCASCPLVSHDGSRSRAISRGCRRRLDALSRRAAGTDEARDRSSSAARPPTPARAGWPRRSAPGCAAGASRSRRSRRRTCRTTRIRAAAGGEIGRAQVAQAEACGLEPEPAMNPILLKPNGNGASQVVVNGRVWKTLTAREYYAHADELRATVLDGVRRSRQPLRRRSSSKAPAASASSTCAQHDLVNLGLVTRDPRAVAARRRHRARRRVRLGPRHGRIC